MTKKQLTQKQLATKALKAKELDIEAKALADEAKAAKNEVLAAMQRQGIKALEQRLGDTLVRINMAEPETTNYNEDAILRAIRRKDEKLAKEVTKVTVSLDYTKFLTAVQQGRIPHRLVEKHVEVVPKTPYVTITLKE